MDAYATPAQYAEWTGSEAGSEDSSLPRMLLRASELVEGRVLTGYATDTDGNPTDSNVRAWLADAACAQVEFWGVVSEEHGIAGVTTGTLSAGGVTHNMPNLVGPRVIDILDRAGLRMPGWYGATSYRRPLDLIGRHYTRVDGVTIEQTTGADQ